MSKSWWWIGGLLVSAVAGCGDPGTLVPTAPPGIDVRTKLDRKEPENEGPQALGEQVATSGAAPKKRNVVSVPPAEPTRPGEVKTTASGVKYTTLKEGTGAVAKSGQRLTLHYVGTLEDGRKFDSSRDRGKPYQANIGVEEVVRGWDEAVPGMKIGEIRKLTIPPNAGYGAQGHPPAIPPNATLIFEIELIDVQ
jgi:FKBP-type peptidyl-prolyl cis-trans isomerase